MQNKSFMERASIGCNESIERPLCRQCLEEEMEDDCFDPLAENCLAEDDWHSAGEILNKYH